MIINSEKLIHTTIHSVILPDPATPTVAAPAPMNLAAESISRLIEEVWKLRIAGDWNNTKESN